MSAYRIRVYQYGLLKPTLNPNLISEQIYYGHRYHNEIVAIERRRDEAVRTLLRTFDADLAAAFEHEDGLRQRVRDAQNAVKSARQKTRSRSDTPEMRQRVRDFKKELVEATKARREIQKRTKRGADLNAQIALLNEAAHEAALAAYGTSPAFWGTKLSKNQSLDLAKDQVFTERKKFFRDCARQNRTRPTDLAMVQFKRWNGGGQIACQIQKGLAVQTAFGTTDQRFQILPPQPVPLRGGRVRPLDENGNPRGKPLHRIRMRIGSDGRTPVWGEWPVILHRPLPENGVISWVKVRREIEATREKWTVDITVREPYPDAQDVPESDIVALDIGWRRHKGTLRAGYIRDSDGVGGEILVDPQVLFRLSKADSIRSTRDTDFDDIRAWFEQWRSQLGDVPAWLSEQTQSLSQWRSTARFRNLILLWRSESWWLAHVEAFNRLDDWAKRDEHLHLYESGLRRRALNQRNDAYKRLASGLARRYRVLVVEDLNLSDMQRHVPTESENPEIHRARHKKPAAAPGELRSELMEAFASRGRVVAAVSAAGTSETCHQCGQIDVWDDPAALLHTCSGCGLVWDRDENACRNLLTRYSEQSGSEEPCGKDFGAVPETNESRWGKRLQSSKNHSHETSEVDESTEGSSELSQHL